LLLRIRNQITTTRLLRPIKLLDFKVLRTPSHTHTHTHTRQSDRDGHGAIWQVVRQNREFNSSAMSFMTGATGSKSKTGSEVADAFAGHYSNRPRMMVYLYFSARRQTDRLMDTQQFHLPSSPELQLGYVCTQPAMALLAAS